MKTLVIHPQDSTTDFLCPIYENIKDKTVIRTGLTKEEIIKQIKQHERVIMLGHGSPYGLLNIGGFKIYSSHIIDATMVEYLKDKDNIYIWCNADIFVERNNLKGFFSGMFISEVGEAIYCGLKNVTQKMVTNSNVSFARSVGKVVGGNTKEIFHEMKKRYRVISRTNPVAFYNHQRLFVM